jgi:hypothetical protein
MKTILEKLIVLMVLLFSVNTFAAEKQTIMKLTLKDAEGDNFNLTVISYVNHLESREVRIEARGLPRLNSSINPILGFGRDTDDNGKIDTWFFITDKGMDVTVKEGKDDLGRDVLGSLLQDKYRSSFMMYVSSATTSLLSYLFMSGSESINIEEEYFRDYMDLEENRLVFERELENMSTSLTRKQLMFQYELTSLGFRALADKMDAFVKRGFWGYALADVGLWISGSYILKWVGKVLYKTGLIVSEMSFINALKETFIGFFEKQKAQLSSKLSVLKEKMHLTGGASKKAATEAAFVLSTKTWKVALKNTLLAKKTKGRIARTIFKGIKWPTKVLGAAAKEWKYILIGPSLQLGAEAYARHEDIQDDNPAVMAQNLITNSEVQQNIAYMTTETILMTGLSKNLKTTKAKFLASGAVALTNSSILNLAIKDNPDLKRMAVDTGWEMVIGNAQVQLELKSLEFFEKLALKNNNPKLKLLGYAIVFVDTSIGYVVYSKVTSAVDKKETKKEVPKKEEPKMMLVPILAEAA